MTSTILIMIHGVENPVSVNACLVLSAALSMPAQPVDQASNRFLLLLALDAYAKAERAMQRWQAAQRTGDQATAERARRLMLRHQAIAYHLDPNRGTK